MLLRKLKISVSILDSDLMMLKDRIDEIEKSGAEYVHIDVMDGHFVPKISFGSPLIKNLKKYTNLVSDVHLMVQDASKFVDQFLDCADILTFHFEENVHIHRIVKKIKDANIKVGIALVPSTPIFMLEEIIEELDQVLIMTVNPGFGGQSLIEKCIDKVAKLNEMKKAANLNFKISCDGGVNEQNARKLEAAGANILIVGTSFFKNENKKEFVENLKGFFSA